MPKTRSWPASVAVALVARYRTDLRRLRRIVAESAAELTVVEEAVDRPAAVVAVVKWLAVGYFAVELVVAAVLT